MILYLNIHSLVVHTHQTGHTDGVGDGDPSYDLEIPFHNEMIQIHSTHIPDVDNAHAFPGQDIDHKVTLCHLDNILDDGNDDLHGDHPSYVLIHGYHNGN